MDGIEIAGAWGRPGGASAILGERNQRWRQAVPWTSGCPAAPTGSWGSEGQSAWIRQGAQTRRHARRVGRGSFGAPPPGIRDVRSYLRHRQVVMSSFMRAALLCPAFRMRRPFGRLAASSEESSRSGQGRRRCSLRVGYHLRRAGAPARVGSPGLSGGGIRRKGKGPRRTGLHLLAGAADEPRNAGACGAQE